MCVGRSTSNTSPPDDMIVQKIHYRASLCVQTDLQHCTWLVVVVNAGAMHFYI